MIQQSNLIVTNLMEELPERAIPRRRQKTQKIMRFFQPNLSKSVGNNTLARMSRNAVKDRQKATSAFVIPVKFLRAIYIIPAYYSEDVFFDVYLSSFLQYCSNDIGIDLCVM